MTDPQVVAAIIGVIGAVIGTYQCRCKLVVAIITQMSHVNSV